MTDRYESRATTHADDCWSWGPAHYDCAVKEIERLREKLSKMRVAEATAQASPTKSLPLTFIQGVLCSLSILDGYGDSIAYREVANAHDPNQLWEEADEFDREHLARHGYRPRKQGGEQ